MTIGEKIRKYRKASGISQLNLEMMMHSSPGHISRIENNVVNPNKETLLKIIDKLDLETNEAHDLLGISYSKLDKYFPSKLAKQRISSNTTLNSFVNQDFDTFAYYRGRDYFIKECDSTLSSNSKEIFYILNMNNWRKVYTAEIAQEYHVPERIRKRKFAKFILNNSSESYEFARQDKLCFRESKFLDKSSSFEYSLMIDNDSLTIFASNAGALTFTIKNASIAENARQVFNNLWLNT